MGTYRRYSRKTKATAVIAATVSTVAAAAETTGIPEATLRSWVDRPEFKELRAKTREDLAEGSFLLARLAQAELQRKVQAGEVEPRDLAVIYGIAIEKGQLIAGEATRRVESRDLAGSFNDDEKAAMADLLKRAIEEPVVEA